MWQWQSFLSVMTVFLFWLLVTKMLKSSLLTAHKVLVLNHFQLLEISAGLVKVTLRPKALYPITLVVPNPSAISLLKKIHFAAKIAGIWWPCWICIIMNERTANSRSLLVYFLSHWFSNCLYIALWLNICMWINIVQGISLTWKTRAFKYLISDWNRKVQLVYPQTVLLHLCQLSRKKISIQGWVFIKDVY